MRHSSSLHAEDQQACSSARELPREGVATQSLQTSHCCFKSHLLLSYPNAPKSISTHSDDGQLHQPICQECHAYSVCLFPSRSTICSSLKEEDIILLCGSWCRYLRFSAGIFHVSLTPFL